MANFQVMQEAMRLARTSKRDSVGTAAQSWLEPLIGESWWVGGAAQELVERVLSTVDPGSFVVRRNDRSHNQLIVMAKLKSGRSISRRIAYRRREWVIEGSPSAFATCHELLNSLDYCQKPAGLLVRSAQGTMERGSAGISTPEITGAPAPKPRVFLENAMTLAEGGDFSGSYRDLERGAAAGASEKNVRLAREYIEALAADQENVPSQDEDAAAQQQPATQPAGSAKVITCGGATDAGAARVKVKVALDEAARQIGLTGTAMCVVRGHCIQLAVAGSSAVDPRHAWPLPYLRKYGRDGTDLYFEAGRRCQSGPMRVRLRCRSSDDAAQVYRAIEVGVTTALQSVRAARGSGAAGGGPAAGEPPDAQIAARNGGGAGTGVIAGADAGAANPRIWAREETGGATPGAGKRDAVPHDPDPDRQAGSPAPEPTYALASPAHAAPAARASVEARLGSAVDVARGVSTVEVTAEKTAEVEVRKGDSVPDTDSANAWGAGKSKIWHALNPQPLAYETVEDKRKREDERVHLEAVGERDYFGETRPDVACVSAPVIRDDDHGVNDAEHRHESATEETDTEEVEEVFDPTALEAFPDDFMEMLGENRVERAAQEEHRRAELRRAFEIEEQRKQAGLEKELAGIEAEQQAAAEQQRRREAADIAEAQRRLATELVFDFTFN